MSARIKGFAWSASNKSNVYEHSRSLIFDRKLVFAEHLRSIIMPDFENISRIVNEAGQVKYSAGRNENGHSDASSALFLALWAAHDSPASFAMPQTWSMNSLFGMPMHSRLG